MNYLTPKQASEYYNVSRETLRQWAEDGTVKFTKTEGGHRRYAVPEPKQSKKFKYLYSRVSSKKQEGDLERQTQFLKERYPDFEVIEDIGSGLNFKRKGFRKILEQLFQGNIEEVVISSSDRFSRFGTRDFFGYLFERFGGKLTILENASNASLNQELSEDLLEIITVFTARYHGRRSYTNNKEN